MSWTTAHFAMGMGCAALIGTGVCALKRRGWRWLPVAMTVGGLWALLPDLPRVWREDAPWLPLASVLGPKSLENRLHSFGDLFFLHRWMDQNLPDLALHGLVAIVVLYNLSLGLLLWLEHRARNSPGNRAWRAHAPVLRQLKLVTDDDQVLLLNELDALTDAPAPELPDAAAPPPSLPADAAVLHRIRPDPKGRAAGE